MRAIVCSLHGGPEVMQLQEVPRPEPAEHELLVKTAAIGVNYVDTMRRSGRHPTAPDPPFIPGIELCGTVDALGDSVGGFREGDRVIGRCISHGAYAEYVAVESRFAVQCPEGMPAEEAAAFFVNPQTAYHALLTVGQLAENDSVLITAAAGGVGLCAVRMAKIRGAQVVAAAGSDDKLELAREFGADVLVNYSRPDWPQVVLEVTDGRGVDLVLDSVGGEVFQQALQAWAPGGRLVVFGKASGTPGQLTGDDLLFGNRTAYGLAVGTVIENEALMRSAMDRIFDWWRSGQFRVHIGETHPLRDAARAHRSLASRQTTGKVVLVP